LFFSLFPLQQRGSDCEAELAAKPPGNFFLGTVSDEALRERQTRRISIIILAVRGNPTLVNLPVVL